jgi:hypothetical protein
VTAPTIPEWELWACADATLRQHGEQAALFVAGRIGALVLAGDEAGVETWKAIGRRVVELQSRPDALTN